MCEVYKRVRWMIGWMAATAVNWIEKTLVKNKALWSS